MLKETMVLSGDDASMVEDFFKHYNNPDKNDLQMSDELKNLIDKFKTNAQNCSLQDQYMFTVELCDCLRRSSHPLLNDEALKEVIAACTVVADDGKFDEAVTATLSSQDQV